MNAFEQKQDIVELFPIKTDWKIKIIEEGNVLSDSQKEELNNIIRMHLCLLLINTDHELDIRIKDNKSMKVVLKEKNK